MYCYNLYECLQDPGRYTAISLSNIGDEGAISLAEILKTNPTVTKIVLSRNNIGAKGAIALAEILKTNPSITKLDLDFNSIGDKGAIALADALKNNNSVTEIYLSQNQVSSEGVIALAEALKNNNSVTGVYLMRNQTGDKGAIALAEALKNNHFVTDIDLYQNHIGIKGATALVNALQTNHSVNKLGMHNNQIYAERAIIDKLLVRNRMILENVSDMLKTLFQAKSKETRIDKLKDYASDYRASWLKEFLNHADVFKERLKLSVSYNENKFQEIHSLILDNYLSIHAVAKNTSVFKVLPSTLMGYIVSFLNPGDIDLTNASLVKSSESDSAHAPLLGQGATPEHPDCGHCCTIS